MRSKARRARCAAPAVLVREVDLAVAGIGDRADARDPGPPDTGHAARLHALLPVLLALLALLLAACGRDNVRQAPPLSPVAARLAESVTVNAIGLVGTPYRYGGNTPQGGFDCSGLIVYVYREGAGVALPRTVRSMADGPWPRVGVDRLASGDVVFFANGGGGPDHAGIYVGEGRFVHAPSSGGTVRLDRLDSGYWQGRARHGIRLLR
jgi:hypothetical protein